ncbi:MAG: iron-sulfur cluster assembly protein [Collinsella sp.]
MDIVDLGLIYDVTVTELENGLHHVAVKMTLTAPGCGMGPHLVMEAKDRIEALEGVEARMWTWSGTLRGTRKW